MKNPLYKDLIIRKIVTSKKSYKINKKGKNLVFLKIFLLFSSKYF